MIYKIEDLNSGEFCGRDAQSTPEFFAVLGKPIGHSLSPVMQNAALAEIAASDTRYRGSKYFAFEVAPENLAEALAALRAKNFKGINLTIPHKEVAMSIVRDFDTSAAAVGACNTLLNTPDGWRGFNTDGFGVEKAIETAFSRSIKGANIIIIGAGGAARATAFHVLLNGCKTFTIINRSKERLEKLSADIKKAGFACAAMSLGDPIVNIPDSPIIINATSLGLKAEDPSCVDFSLFPRDSVFFDMPYAKGRETASVAAAKSRGIKACGGLPMLAWQGAKSLSIWTGKPLLGDLMLATLNSSQK